jgi:hypothetical protein
MLSMRPEARRDGRDRFPVWVGVALVAALVASVMPLSHDEAFWLAITRKLETGARLYDGAIDNKPPSVFLVTYLLDSIPGSFQVARGLLVGGLIASVGALSGRLGSMLGNSRQRAIAVGVVAAAVVALQTEFVFSVELPALVALLGSLWLILRRRVPPAAGLAAVALGFDPRTVLLLPALVLFGADQHGWKLARRFAGWAGALTVLGIGVVWFQPDLRYGLIELNLGTRTSAGGWRPSAQLAVALRGLLPLLVGGFLLRASPALAQHRTFVAMAFGSLAIGFLSVLPFDHYWAYSVLAFIFLTACTGLISPRVEPVVAVVLVAVSFVPLIINAVDTGLEQRNITARYANAAALIDAQLQESDQFVSFDIKPYMASYLPDAYALRSPVSGYLVWPTSRTDRYLDELPSLIDASVAISEDGGLGVDRAAISEEYLPVWDRFAERLEDFPCVVEIDGIILRFRADRCPQP